MGDGVGLSTMEQKFMDVIWKHPEGISSGTIYALFPQAISTKSTILGRIVKKGYARTRQVGKQVLYFPVITEREYNKKIMEKQIEKKLGYLSFSGLFAAFCGKTKLTEEEYRKLEELIHDMETDK